MSTVTASISGSLAVSSPDVLVLRLSAANPLVELRSDSDEYLAFLQVFGSDLYLRQPSAGKSVAQNLKCESDGDRREREWSA